MSIANTPGECGCPYCEHTDARSCEINNCICCTIVRLIRTHDSYFTGGEELQPK